MVGIGHRSLARHVGGAGHARGDADRGVALGPGIKIALDRRGRAHDHRQGLPVARGQFPLGEFPHHDLAAGQAVAAVGHFLREDLASGVGPRVVAGDAVDRALQVQAQVFGKSRTTPPPHAGQGEDVGETVTQQQHLGLGIGGPRSTAGGQHLGQIVGLGREETLLLRQLEHGDDVALGSDALGLRGPCGGGGGEHTQRLDFGRSRSRRGRHELRGPMGVGLEEGVGWVFGAVGGGEVRAIDQRNTRTAQSAGEFIHGRIARRAGRRRGKAVGFNGRFVGRDQHNQRDAASLQLIAEAEDGRERIGEDRGRAGFAGVFAAGELAGIQEAGAGHAIDVGAVEQPAVAADVGLLVAGAGPAAEERLGRAEEGVGQEGRALQLGLVVLHRAHESAVDLHALRPGRSRREDRR